MPPAGRLSRGAAVQRAHGERFRGMGGSAPIKTCNLISNVTAGHVLVS